MTNESTTPPPADEPLFPPLLTACDKCGGEGEVLRPAWRDYYAVRDRRAEELLREGSTIHDAIEAINEIPRPQCSEKVGCRECYGRGQVITPAGRQIVELLETADVAIDLKNLMSRRTKKQESIE